MLTTAPSLRDLTADGSSVYKYDIENRLVERRTQLSPTCPTTTSGYDGTLLATLVYDPLGRLPRVGEESDTIANTTRSCG